MILMQAPGANMAFGLAPSGSTYISDQYGLIYIVNDAAADQTALQNAGCFTLSPFGGWGNYGFSNLSSLYAADTGTIFTGITGYPQHTVVTIFSDGTSSNDGTWQKTGTGSGSGNWTQVSTSSLAALAAEVAAAIPWSGQTWAQVSQIKAALLADDVFDAVQAAMPADPTQSATQQWNGGGIATVGGPLGQQIQTSLSYSDAQMTALWALASGAYY